MLKGIRRDLINAPYDEPRYRASKRARFGNRQEREDVSEAQPITSQRHENAEKRQKQCPEN